MAEREKNNQLKHENADLNLCQTRNRETMHQQANLVEFLQRQNEDLTPQKKKGKGKPSPRQFAPPPLYKDLERQIDLLRTENSKLKSKLYGSNTMLDKIDTKIDGRKSRDGSPKRGFKIDLKNLRKSTVPMTTIPASFVGLCSVSSLPIYIGDMIVKKNG